MAQFSQQLVTETSGKQLAVIHNYIITDNLKLKHTFISNNMYKIMYACVCVFLAMGIIILG